MSGTKLRAVVVAAAGHDVSRVVTSLERRGIAAMVRNDAMEALDECRQHPPDLAIVEKTMDPMDGVRFVSELLKVSWTTSTILIANEEEEALHDQTEGLGILGAIKSLDDIRALEAMLDRFCEVIAVQGQ